MASSTASVGLLRSSAASVKSVVSLTCVGVFVHGDGSKRLAQAAAH